MANKAQAKSAPAEAEKESGEDGHQRQFRRRSVLWPAKLRVGNHEFTAQVWNVSLGGAKLRVDLPIKEGTATAILIPAKGIEIPAEVVWQSGELLGVFFSFDAERVKDIFENSATVLGLDAPDSGKDK